MKILPALRALPLLLALCLPTAASATASWSRPHPKVTIRAHAASNLAVGVGNTGCTLHAYVPFVATNGQIAGQGMVDCANNAHIQLKVCVDEGNGAQACNFSSCGWGNAQCSQIWENSAGLPRIAGHRYWTWDWAYVNGQTATYQSSVVYG